MSGERKIVLRRTQDNPELCRRVAIFDFDGTLVSAHLWGGIIKRSLETKTYRFPAFWYFVSHIALTPFWRMRLISTENYYKSWVRDMGEMIKGMKIDEAKEMFNWLSDEYLLPTLKKSVFERLKKHQAEGFLIVLASGTFQELLKVVANRLNIDFAVGTELEIIKDRFSGKVMPPICFREGKAEKVKSFLFENNFKIDFEKSFAYSDGFFDLPMLELVGNPVVVEPDDKLLEIAKNRNWQII